jgi:hypothetical protein
MKKSQNNHEQFWLTKVEPYSGESISHFLGRFRRARGNRFSTASGLGQVVGLGAVLVRWEKFYFNPFPTQQELEALANIVMVDVERIKQMFPPQGTTMKCKPTLLCAACYQENPYHRLEWQFKDKRGCDRHKVRFLSKCINCGTFFPIPSQWEIGKCRHCRLPFAKMARHQQLLK